MTSGYLYADTVLDRQPLQAYYVTDIGPSGNVGQDITITLPAAAQVGDMIIFSSANYYSHNIYIAVSTALGGIHMPSDSPYWALQRRIYGNGIFTLTCVQNSGGNCYWKGVY